jgi:hypothetical protein
MLFSYQVFLDIALDEALDEHDDFEEQLMRLAIEQERQQDDNVDNQIGGPDSSDEDSERHSDEEIERHGHGEDAMPSNEITVGNFSEPVLSQPPATSGTSILDGAK